MNTDLDYVTIFDNVISKKNCEKLIKIYKKTVIKEKGSLANYYYTDIDVRNFSYNKEIFECIEKYKINYPEINLTASYWGLVNLRFKFWKKGDFFNQFHSEHCFSRPNRLLSLQIYLSNHDCGTEFYNKKVIKSKVGRVCLFPAYFTHTHKGQPDLTKNRYLITGYFEFFKLGKFE